jgi:hypothetical protein
MKSLREQYPERPGVRKNTDELKEIRPRKRVHEFLYDTIYSERALCTKELKTALAIYFEFLSKTSQEAYKELQDFISETIKKPGQK